MASKAGTIKTNLFSALLLTICTFPSQAEEVDLPWFPNEYCPVVMCGGLLSISILFFAYSKFKYRQNHPILLTAFNELAAYILLDHRFRVIRSSNEFKKLNGYELKDIIGTNPFPSIVFTDSYKEKKDIIACLANRSRWQGELSTIHKDGYIQKQLIKIQLIKAEHSDQNFYMIVFIDISEQKKIEHQLRMLSEKDPLTGIWNRRKFDQELRTFSKLCSRYTKQTSGCLAIIDIDHFKRVNDTLGHDIGDHVLQYVTAKLKSHLRETDVLARVGGEEFAVILHQTSVEEARQLLNRLRMSIDNDTSIPCTVSCGITDISSVPEDVYKRADVALYDAKSSGRNKVVVLESNDISQIPLTNSPQLSA